MVDLAITDASVTALLGMSQEPWKELRHVPGENHDIELTAIRLAIRDLGARDLSDDEYDAELARLRAERNRLEALPNVPDCWEEVETGQTVGEHFTGLDYEGKRAMLLDNVKLFAQPGGEQKVNGRNTRVPMLGLESRLFKMPVEWIGEPPSQVPERAPDSARPVL